MSARFHLKSDCCQSGYKKKQYFAVCKNCKKPCLVVKVAKLYTEIGTNQLLQKILK